MNNRFKSICETQKKEATEKKASNSKLLIGAVLIGDEMNSVGK
jgi:hypothetical protein